ncbi:STAS domain-containing protein [Streptomyces sp. NPDC005180]|uniref:STAS domain-containing protein n=1 Tax=Streptomyces sp. NPDC005180 TaxID=3156868 RepID=UPI0033A19C7B
MAGQEVNGSGSERIEVEARDGCVVVRTYGEMDVARAKDFREALLGALGDASRVGQVVVDLQHLTFCDSTGLYVLMDARAVAAEHGQRLYLAAPRDQFIRLLEITGSLDLFTIEPAPPF